jgi:tRNA threonylcarbamoyladenosine biosynthesis protein TsaB
MSALLFIDTSAATATIALSENGEISALLRHRGARDQAAVLNVLIERVLREGGKAMPQLDAVCVCAGPGSYTGLRVGLSVAKGIAFALDKPLMLFDRMTLIALHLTMTNKLAQKKAVVLKAREAEYFMACFDEGNQVFTAPQHVFVEELQAGIPATLSVITDEVLPIKNEQTILPPDFELNISPWSALAAKRLARQEFDDLAYSEPFYLKTAYTTISKK